MSSFNISCGVSHQTISVGDRCVVALVLQQSAFYPTEGLDGDKSFSAYGMGEDRHSPTRAWAPVSEFFDAEYADQGCFALQDTLRNRHRLVQFIQNCLTHTPVVSNGGDFGEASFNLREFMTSEAPDLLARLSATAPVSTLVSQDNLVDQAVACWEYICSSEQQDRLFWRSHTQVIRAAKLFVAHREAYTELARTTDTWTDWDGTSVRPRAVFDRVVASFKQDASLESSGADDPSFEGDLAPVYLARKLSEAFQRIGQYRQCEYLAENTAIGELALSFVEGEFTEDQFFELLEPLVEARYAIAGMHMLYLAFEPVTHVGGDTDNSTGRAYAEFMSKVSHSCNGTALSESKAGLLKGLKPR